MSEDANKDLFQAAGQIWNLALKIKVGNIPNEDWAHCLAGVQRKQMGLYQACCKLCAEGLALEAQILERTMFMLWGYLNEMKNASTPTEFARLWLIWDYANQEKNIRPLLSLHPENKDVQAQIQRLEQKTAADKSKMGKDWDRFMYCGPALKTPTQIAKDLDPSVKTYFHDISGTVHGYDLWSFAKYPSNDDPGGLVSETCAHVPISIMRYLGLSVLIINESLNFHKDSEITALIDILQKIDN
ncbi:MAG: hypothetical protein ABH841_01240 [Candidatus Nealsonbacteria bacterium]